MTAIITRRIGDVLVVASNNPPVNALSADVRIGLAEAIGHAARDELVKSVVIIAEGRTFFAGADITEFGKPLREPGLAAVCDAIEKSTKPIVAAIHGTALGGGLEVALACHYRIAVPSALFGFPEVKLGILPGAGGTQRLPRVVGVAAALQMIVSGDSIRADKASAIGLIDHIAGETNLKADAISFAQDVIGMSIPISSARQDKISEADTKVIEQFRQDNARRFEGFEAPEACVQAVAAAIRLPYDKGRELERDLFAKLVSSTQSAALRHVFFAERAAAKIDDVPADTPLIPIARVGVLGAGTMGGGIAMNFLSAGIPITLLEREQAALDRGVGIIRKNYEATAKKGRMKAEQVESAMALLKPTLSYDDLTDCDLVIEAVFELMEIKKEVFKRLDGTVKQGAILATNTSFLNVDEIAAVTSRPQDVIGLHFFSPANVMKLLEIVRGARTSKAVLATAMAMAKRIKKVAVVAGVCHGFIGNRMLEPRQTQADALVLEGAKPAEVDQVLLDFGFPMGPFQMLDLAGLDLAGNRRSLGETPFARFFANWDGEARRPVRDTMTMIGSAVAPPPRRSTRSSLSLRLSGRFPSAKSVTRKFLNGCFTQWSTKARRSFRNRKLREPRTSISSGSMDMVGLRIRAVRCSGRTPSDLMPSCRGSITTPTRSRTSAFPRSSPTKQPRARPSMAERTQPLQGRSTSLTLAVLRNAGTLAAVCAGECCRFILFGDDPCVMP
jgi:3-hydroxyacyl-CoA dehydrogenase